MIVSAARQRQVHQMRFARLPSGSVPPSSPRSHGKGVLPADHFLSLDMTLDQEGTQEFIRKAGLVVAIGTELAEPDVWASDTLPMNGKFLRIDIDAETLARDYRPDVAVLGDAGVALAGILERL